MWIRIGTLRCPVFDPHSGQDEIRNSGYGFRQYLCFAARISGLLFPFVSRDAMDQTRGCRMNPVTLPRNHQKTIEFHSRLVQNIQKRQNRQQHGRPNISADQWLHSDVPCFQSHFSISLKNGAVRLFRLFATCSGVPAATILPPSAPASGPISMR